MSVLDIIMILPEKETILNFLEVGFVELLKNKLCILLIVEKNIRLIGDEHHIGDDFEFVIYKVQIKVLWFWVTIKEFDEDEYYDAVDCFRYCTNPYIN